MSIALVPTPFHARTAEHNSANAWLRRGRYTVPAHYGDPQREALAARFSCILADMSALDEIRIEGAGAAVLAAAGFGPQARALSLGHLRPVHWCADGGGVRGFGTLLRMSEDEFLLRSADCDLGWFAPAAPRFAGKLRETGEQRGLLMLSGGFAAPVLAAAGLELASLLEPHEHKRHNWRHVEVALSREPRLDAYFVSCEPEDASLAFDRLMRAGRAFGLCLAGQQAVELLQLEAGLILPHLDFEPARTPFAREPFPAALGLAAATETTLRVLAGIEFDDDEPRPFAPLLQSGLEVGRTLRSAYSLALRRAIALAQMHPIVAKPGTILELRDRRAVARVVSLPFLER